MRFTPVAGGLKLVWAIVAAVVTFGLSMVGGDRAKAARANLNAAVGAERTRNNTIMILGVTAALIVIPLVTGKITQELLANVGIFLLLALGLNIVVGLAGILDLGYVAFFAVGGYTTAVLTSPNRGESWPDWVPLLDGPGGWAIALAITIVFAAIVGLFIGAPVIRMRGDYLAIVTLGFGEIIRLLFLSDWLNGLLQRCAGHHWHPACGLRGVRRQGNRSRGRSSTSRCSSRSSPSMCRGGSSGRDSVEPGWPSARTRASPRRWASTR